jgi:hypothetical protein
MNLIISYLFSISFLVHGWEEGVGGRERKEEVVGGSDKNRMEGGRRRVVGG